MPQTECEPFQAIILKTMIVLLLIGFLSDYDDIR